MPDKPRHPKPLRLAHRMTKEWEALAWEEGRDLEAQGLALIADLIGYGAPDVFLDDEPQSPTPAP